MLKAQVLSLPGVPLPGLLWITFQVGTLQCTEPYDSRNRHIVLNGLSSQGPLNPQIRGYYIGNTGLPASQCLPEQHLFTDNSLSFASKIIFLWLFESLLVVILCASVDILMPVPTYQCQPPVATGLPASQCPLVQHPCTDSSLSFASKIMFLGLFEGSLVVILCASAGVLMPAPHSCWSASLTMPDSATSVH